MMETGYICGQPEVTSQDEDLDYYPSKFEVKRFLTEISMFMDKV